MYELNLSNFFYLNSRISVSGFFVIAYINNISNLQWLQLRFFTFNKYDLSFFLFKTRRFKEIYLNIVFYNRSVGIFSKYYNYFFTTELFEDNFVLVEKDFDQIKIKCYGFFFIKYFITFGTFLHYKKFTLLNLCIPFLQKISFPYRSILKYEIVFRQHLYYYLYAKIILFFLIYKKTITSLFNVYY